MPGSRWTVRGGDNAHQFIESEMSALGAAVRRAFNGGYDDPIDVYRDPGDRRYRLRKLDDGDGIPKLTITLVEEGE